MIEVSTSGPKSAVNGVTRSRVFERFARAGFVMAGIVHLLIGYLAVRLAFGGGGATDQSGAMAELAAKPGGVPALVVGVAAFPHRHPNSVRQVGPIGRRAPVPPPECALTAHLPRWAGTRRRGRPDPDRPGE